jgi:protocatechuate 3,4-dioxygenase alpha subunit
MAHGQTPSQTVGPFFAYGLTPRDYQYPGRQIAGGVIGDAAGEGRILIHGRVLDGKGEAIPDALVEVWQADSAGRYDNANFSGFGRQGTGVDSSSRFRFETVKPGAIAAGHAPHLNLILFMRGLLTHLYTRVYFSDEAHPNANDPVLSQVPTARRRTLIAICQDQTGGLPSYVFDIHMQGEHETVFFDF